MAVAVHLCPLAPIDPVGISLADSAAVNLGRSPKADRPPPGVASAKADIISGHHQKLRTSIKPVVIT